MEMAAENHSSVTEFTLAGLTEHPQLQLPLFLLFLGIYVVTVVGNLGMIILIGLSSHLHIPMYYFLSSLSFIDLCQSTVITPRMLGNFGTEKNIISYPECMTQLFFFLLFIIAEGYLLAAMSTMMTMSTMSTMLPSVAPCCIILPCPIKPVSPSFLNVYDGTGMCILSHRLHA